MARRWAEASAFRPDPGAAQSVRPSWRQSLALVTVLLVVAGVVATVSYLVKPDRARAFDLLHGSVLIGDQFGPVSVDLASGKGTLQLRGADQQVGVTAPGDLGLVPFDGGTLLLNRRTGQFNMVDRTGFLVKRNGGVTIGGRSGATTATGVGAGPLAYIERTGPSGTDILLVGPSTVATAAADPRSVRPRASYTTTGRGITAEGGAVGANGDLWTLVVRPDGSTDLQRFSLPAGSSTGAMLRESDEGTVPRLSAVASAAVDDGTGTDVVGVASPGRLRVIAPDGTARTLRYRAPAGLDTVLATTGASGRLSWLLHGTAGWSVVSVRADGTGLAGPTVLGTVDPDARLAPPAQSSGALYTMVRSGEVGAVYRIGFHGRVDRVVAAYPQRTAADGRRVEGASFTDGYVIARDSRVVVDSPGHYLALTLFTDGSRGPLVIQKTKVTSVNAAAGAEALTQGSVTTPPKGSTPPKTPGTPVKTVAPEVNNRIDCDVVNQKPHVPQIATVAPAARSVGVSWVYPVFDTQDCLPSTYVVGVRLISNDAPPAPGAVTLQKQTDTILAGLYPDTTYELTVTAYLNGQSTSSRPVRVQTGKEGPAAPSGVTVTADDTGNWDIAWRGCGTGAGQCVPAGSWTITPAFCDGLGLTASPASITSPADPTSVVQPAAVFRGGGDLLGRSLQFRIRGTGDDGTLGDVSAPSGCVRSWATPRAGGIHVAASTPPRTGSVDDSTSTTVSVTFDDGATADLGGVGGTLTYRLVHAGETVASAGPTTDTTVQLAGIQPGLQYQVEVTATPPGHPEAAVSLAPVAVSQASAQWPDLGAVVDPGSVVDDGSVGATAELQVTGLSSADANGERFDVTYQLRCGNAAPAPATATGVDPARPITVSIDRSQFYGTCTIALQRVVESDGGGVFGGTPAPHLGTSDEFTVDQPTFSGVQQSDFSAVWAGSTSQSAVHIRYSGDNPLLALSASWTVAVSGPGGDCTFGYTDRGSLDDVPVSQDCVDKYQGNGAGWTVTVTVVAAGQTQGPYTVNGIEGVAPSYQAPTCTTDSLTAHWSGTASSPSVTLGADATAVKNCTGWSYRVASPTDATCGTASGPPPVTVSVACGSKPTAKGWTVSVTYTGVDNTTHTAVLNIDGKPPA